MIFYFLAFLTQSFAMNSKATPIDSVNLNGAKLLALTGGGGVKRRDLQKGFAIIECSGKHSFFMTETFAEYEKWVIAIQRSLSSQNNNLKDQAPFDILVDADIIETESGSSDFDSEDCESEMTDGSETSCEEEESMDGGNHTGNVDKKCSCIMCDETCHVDLSTTHSKPRKRAVGKRKTTRKITRKG